MKYVLAFLQLILFLAIFLIGSMLPGIGLMPMETIPAGSGRVFVVDGLVLALLVYLLLLGVEAARKTLRSSGLRTTVAFGLAVVLGLLMKFGFKTV